LEPVSFLPFFLAAILALAAAILAALASAPSSIAPNISVDAAASSYFFLFLLSFPPYLVDF
jgi:hypothetical protein